MGGGRGDEREREKEREGMSEEGGRRDERVGIGGEEKRGESETGQRERGAGQREKL